MCQNPSLSWCHHRSRYRWQRSCPTHCCCWRMGLSYDQALRNACGSPGVVLPCLWRRCYGRIRQCERRTLQGQRHGVGNPDASHRGDVAESVLGCILQAMWCEQLHKEATAQHNVCCSTYTPSRAPNASAEYSRVCVMSSMCTRSCAAAVRCSRPHASAGGHSCGGVRVISVSNPIATRSACAQPTSATGEKPTPLNPYTHTVGGAPALQPFGSPSTCYHGS